MAVRDFIGGIRQCEVCGKTINIMDFDDWVFQRKIENRHRRVFMCSWTCLRKYDAEHEKKKK